VPKLLRRGGVLGGRRKAEGKSSKRRIIGNIREALSKPGKNINTEKIQKKTIRRSGKNNPED